MPTSMNDYAGSNGESLSSQEERGWKGGRAKLGGSGELRKGHRRIARVRHPERKGGAELLCKREGANGLPLGWDD